jgi:hypothetical protein
MIDFYSIENGQISKIKSIQGYDIFFVVNDVIYTIDDRNYIHYYDKRETHFGGYGIIEGDNYNDNEIMNFESLNENTFVIRDSKNNVLLHDINDRITKNIKIPRNSGFAIFREFVATAHKYRRVLDDIIILQIDVHDTVKSISSFLF